MKYAADRPFADPDKAARKLIEIANSAEAYMDGRAGSSPRLYHPNALGTPTSSPT
jgi:hypothetical protein